MEEKTLSILNQLDNLEEICLDGPRLPFSANRLVNEQDAIELLDQIREMLPSEVLKASEILKESNKILIEATKQAESILASAKHKRDQMIDSAGVRQEAERQIVHLQLQSKQKCEKLLEEARNESAKIDQQMKVKFSNMERTFINRMQQLEQQSVDRKKEIEIEENEITKRLQLKLESASRKAQDEIDYYRQESLKKQKEAQQTFEVINSEALLLQQKTQQQCDSLLINTRNEAAFIQDGANRYAEQTLDQLEQRLIEISQVVCAGKRELGKIKNITDNIPENQNPNAVPLNKIRRQASKIKDSFSNIA